MIDNANAPGTCFNCEKQFLLLVENGMIHVDRNGNCICKDCYKLLKKDGLASKFSSEWVDKPRHPALDIYDRS